MARRRSFDHLARSVVGSVLASLGGGCSSAEDTDATGWGGVDLTGMDAVACDDGRFNALGDLALPEPADSLDLVDVLSDSDEPAILASSGTRCASAADPEACLAAVEAALTAELQTGQPGFQLGECVDSCSCYILVVTRGDEVAVLRTAAEVTALLAPIDTASEAVWAAQLARYEVGCDDSEQWGVRAAGDAWEVGATRITSSCTPLEKTGYLLSVSSSAEVAVLDQDVISSDSGTCIGRRPVCASAPHARGGSRLGAHVAGLAQLEAESVPAFAELARELAAHGAPGHLIRGARRARRDEIRHARVMTRIARRMGGRPRRPTIAPVAPRALVEIAITNAREGCVREAFGAVVGRWLATRATDPEVRAEMAHIARDEAAHAALSLRIDAWARRTLGPREWAQVEDARTEALAALRAEIDATDVDLAIAGPLGLPTRSESKALLDAFTTALGARAAAPGARTTTVAR